MIIPLPLLRCCCCAEGGTCWAAGKIPTVRDVDGTTLYESNAIVRYLAAKHGEGSLWPVDAADRAQVFRPPYPATRQS